MSTRAFTIPTIYKAVDQLTSPVRKMAAAHAQFARTVETGLATAERVTRKLTPAFSETTKQIFGMIKAAALAGAIIGGISFSIQSLKDYEKALASFRVIVSGLNDDQFKTYQTEIVAVGKATKKSAIEVAASFEKIAGLNSKFAETPKALAQISAAAITLSKASGSELGESAENLVGIMNQFSFAANQANRTINVLAAGQAVGASTIKQTAEAFVNVGSVAAGANISLEQSVALIQTLGKFSIFGAEAGTKLRGVILKLQKAGVGYASGQFNINDALAEARARIDKLKTAKQQDALLNKMFGAENISTGRTLLSNIELYKDYVKGVTGTSEAARGAEINSSKLTDKLDEMKAAWVNILVSSDRAGSALSTVKNIVGFLTDNMETIVSVGSKILIFFAAWKALILITKVVMIAYNIALGVMGALSGTASVAIGANAVALGAYKVVLAIVTAAQWAWNVAMLANPIGLIILGIAALIAIIVIVIRKWEEWGAAVSLFLGPIGMVISLVMAFRRNWDMLRAAFQTGDILTALKAIGAVIFDAILMPVQQLVKLIAEFTDAEWAKNAVKNIEAFRKDLGVSVTPAVNPKAAEQDGMAARMESTKTQNASLTINDKTGRAQYEPGTEDLGMIKFSSTLAY